MSYPFQSPRAQVSSALPSHHQPSPHDPYSNSYQQQPYDSYPADRDWNDDYASHPAYPDQHNQYAAGSQDSNPSRGLHANDNDRYDEYADARADTGVNSPYNNNMYDSPNLQSEKAANSPYSAKRASGNSIWTRDDKRALASRSCPAKVFRLIIGNLILGIILVVSIICLLVMFLRPPNVAISGIGVPNTNAVTYQNGAFAFNVSLDISVSNPNSIAANINKLQVNAYETSAPSTNLAQGVVRNQRINPNANTTVVFPFQIRYSQKQDPDLSIIRNIASSCGINLFDGSSGGSGDLSFLLKVEVDVGVLSVSVPVRFNKTITFPCPLTGSRLEGILSGIGSSLGGRRALLEDAERDGSDAASLARRTEGVAGLMDRDISPVEFAAAIAEGLVKRYSPVSHLASNGKRSVADEHEAL